MDIMTFIQYTTAILELVFFVLTIYSLIKGLQTKNYHNLIKYGIFYFILNLTRRLFELMQKRAISVSVIGGADGPTSIFLAGELGRTFSWVISLVVVLLAAVVIIYLRKKK